MLIQHIGDRNRALEIAADRHPKSHDIVTIGAFRAHLHWPGFINPLQESWHSHYSKHESADERPGIRGNRGDWKWRPYR